MFIDHTILFGCMVWWVRTRVLTLTVCSLKFARVFAPNLLSDMSAAGPALQGIDHLA
jgi:hypothetical protein